MTGQLRRSVAAAIAVAAMVLTGGCGGSSAPASPDASSSSTASLHGAVPDDHALKPSFRLVDTAGHPFDFGTQTAGRATLLYFGYTHCPDECPTSMADVAAALRRVGPSLARQVDVVFVTTDPWRDTRPVLRKWLDRFDPAFIGLTGTPSQIAAAETQMGMPISHRVPVKKRGPQGRYAVDHFAAVLAYGSDNRLATLYPSGVAPSDIAADLPLLVKG